MFASMAAPRPTGAPLGTPLAAQKAPENRLSASFAAAVSETHLFDAVQPSGQSHSALCAHGADVYYAVGSSVHWARVGVDNDYRKLALPGVDYEIRNLSINESGTLLAIIGEHKVVVGSLPSFHNGTSGGNNRLEVGVRSREVGRDVERKGKVLKVVWHPMARYDACLVVLTSDDVIRSYDLSQDYYTPDLEHRLRPDSSKNDAFELNYDEIENPVSIAFGTATDTHGKMTLYVATEAGDMFALCPFLPKRFLMTKDEVTDLFDAAVIAEHEIKQTRDDVSTRALRRCRSQLAWASNLIKQTKTCDLRESKLVDGKGIVEYLVLTRPPARVALELQGPMSISPYPDELYSAHVADIVCLESGALEVLGVCYREGIVGVCLQERGVVPQWELSGISAESPDAEIGVCMVQAIKLAPSFSGSADDWQIIPCDGSFVTFSTSSRQPALKIDISSILDQLHAVLDGAARTPNDLSRLHATSHVTEISAAGSAVLGATLVTYGRSHRFALVVTEKMAYFDDWDWQKISDDLPSEATTAPAFSADKLASSSSESGTGTYTMSYEFAAPYEEITNLLQRADAHKPPVPKADMDLTSKIEPSIESLDYFITLANSYGKRTIDLYKSGLLMSQLLAKQRSELNRQLSKVDDMIKHASALDQSRLSSGLQAIMDKQKTLDARAQSLLEKLLKDDKQPLSDQERQWHRELARIQRGIYESGGLSARFQKAQIISREFRVLQASGMSAKSTPSTDPEVSAYLEPMLQRQRKDIEDRKQQLQTLSESLKSLELAKSQSAA